jgi:transposase
MSTRDVPTTVPSRGGRRAAIRAIVRRLAAPYDASASHSLAVPPLHECRAARQEERALLDRWAGAGLMPQRFARRVRIVLLAGSGQRTRGICEALYIDARTVSRWRRRYDTGGLEGLLHDAAIPHVPHAIARGDDAHRVQELAATPLGGGVRWTIRSLASATGVSVTSVQRILREHRRAAAPPCYPSP